MVFYSNGDGGISRRKDTMKSIKKRMAKLRIVSRMTEYDEHDDPRSGASESDVTEESSTLTTDCTIADKGGRIEIEYEETEITGMNGSVTKLCFDRDEPTLVSLLREGSVSTAFVFEEGRRHLCVYNTPYFPIELCVDTQKLVNTLTFDGGSLHAAYLVEMNGVLAERAEIDISIIG